MGEFLGRRKRDARRNFSEYATILRENVILLLRLTGTMIVSGSRYFVDGKEEMRMFGYVKPWLQDLSKEEVVRYRAVYCGVCRSLSRRYGQLSRFTVNYDMTFLALLLSSLYEPEEKKEMLRCPPHPLKPHEEAMSEIIDYAADMTIAFSYFKCLDDWQDERKAVQKVYAEVLRKHYDTVKARWPRQCVAIEQAIGHLTVLEKQSKDSRDEAIRCAGLLLSEAFVWKNDFWENQLRWFGDALGRFVYLMDAAMDYEKDGKKGCYNLFVDMKIQPGQAKNYILQPLDEVSEAFEGLPLVQDSNLLRNIIYSGVWQDYNQRIRKAEERAHGK